MLYEFAAGIFRGPTPRVRELRARGIRCVVNLEASPFETHWEDTELRAAGIHEYPIPCCPFFPPTLRASRRALAALRADATHPVMVHCREGKNRTGFICALLRIVVHGWSFNRAVQEMRVYGFRYWALWWWIPELRRQATQLRGEFLQGKR